MQTERETAANIERTIEMLVGERERTERGIAQLSEALSPQGIAMRQQLEHRVLDIQRTIGEQWDQFVAIHAATPNSQPTKVTRESWIAREGEAY